MLGRARAAERLDARGTSAGGPTSVAWAPTSRERLDERARDARVQDVADDRDVQPLEPAEGGLHRVEVEQRLGRMLVGLPSPAFTTCRAAVARDEPGRADCGWRTTIAAGSYAASVSTVSFSDSPLSTEEPADLIDIVSADSRFAASSKLDEVRVEDS